MYFICHVTSQDHPIEGSFKFIGESYSWYVTALRSFVTIGILIVDTFLIFHVNSRDHMFKGLCEFMGRNPSQ